MKRDSHNIQTGGESESKRVSRRRTLAATSGVGATFFGLSSAVGGAAADNQDESYLTEDELRKILRTSEHFFATPAVHERVTTSDVSPRSLEPSDLAGRGIPDIYYGKYKNADPPSGKYYKIVNPGERPSHDVPLAFDGTVEDRLLGADDSIRPNDSDFLTWESEIGSGSVLGHEVSVAIKVGLEITARTDAKVGGNFGLDITISAAGQSVIVSPGGFGFWIGPDSDHGYCAQPTVGLPGPLPGKGQVNLCGDLKLYTLGGFPPDKVRFGLKVGFLEVCGDPCPGWNCEACGTIIDLGLEFRSPWISLP